MRLSALGNDSRRRTPDESSRPMMHKRPANPERSFGISVGAVLLLIAVYNAWRGSMTTAQIVGGVGAFLLVSGYVAPRLLKWPSAAWWKLALVLGFVNARVLLTVIFAVVLVPIGLLWRAIGRDPLARRRASWRGWSPHPARYRDPKHYERMY
jgi:hypothetical protein